MLLLATKKIDINLSPEELPVKFMSWFLKQLAPALCEITNQMVFPFLMFNEETFKVVMNLDILSDKSLQA